MFKLQPSRTVFLVAKATVIVMKFCCSIMVYREPLFSFIFIGLDIVSGLFARLVTSLITGFIITGFPIGLQTVKAKLP